jgi:hypothetical protein
MECLMSPKMLMPRVLVLGMLMACGSSTSGSNSNNGPTGPVEIATNPQVWSSLSGEMLLGGLSGFHPTKTVRVDNLLRTYYVRASDGVVVYAESTDGKDLSKTVATNLRRTSVQGDITAGLDHPAVFRRTDGKFVMIYDYVTDFSTNFAKRMVARTSDDGITWGAGVIMPGADEDKSPSAGTIFQGVASMVQLSDGSIRAYYSASGGNVGSARSTDGGTTWIEDVGPRLHVTSGPGFYTDPDAIVDADGSIILYVGKVTDGSCAQSAGTTTGCVPIRMARSTDGLTFTMYAGNVLTPGAGAAVFADPDVFIDPSGKWHMLYGDTNHGVNLLRIADRQ